MVDRTANIHNALEYIEAHLTQEMDIRDVAKQACLSPFYFQRVFSALCGLGVWEYIRCRRLSLAAQEISESDIRIIDAAAKYGYDSPDSFCRAFRRFHGLLPSGARKPGANLRTFDPIQIKFSMEDRSMLEYKIVQKPQFTLVGMERQFHPETSYQEIPKFWDEVMAMKNCPLLGSYGICLDEDIQDGAFTYLIADNYVPWKEVPEGLIVKVIPASAWAVFPCRGPLPQALQEVNTRMWCEWLPNCKDYRLSRNLNIEMYGPPAKNPEDTYSEIWLPVEPV